MRNVITIGLMAAVLTLGACGGEPPIPQNTAPTTPEEVISRVDGALSAGMWLGNLGNWGAGHQFSYQNAGQTWYPRAPITQSALFHVGHPTVLNTKFLGDGINAAFQLDPTVNELTFSCNGSNTVMVDHATYLSNANTETCTTYSHFVGDGGWRIGSTVTIPPGNLVYLQNGTDGQANGYFWVGLAIPRILDGVGTYGIGAYSPGTLGLLFYF